MHKASKRVATSFVFATAALSFFALHCSSDDPAPGGTAGTGNISGSTGGGTGGAATGGGGTTSAGTTSGGSTSGGTTSGGTTSGGTTSGGTASGGGGSGGTAAGAGGGGAGGAAGGSGGSGGAAGGSGGAGGGSGATFAQVKTLLATSCAGNMCHSEPSQHIDWVTENGLYMRLTTPIGNNGEECKDKTAVVPNMPDQSLLLQIVKGSVMCSGKTIPKMPNMCPANNHPCLTEAQIKTISDWISAGAPM